ncbi:MAG: MBL fold metallo-hydrolase [Acetobacterium woodii]|nr:MBL fold metallo-hydrolase [Acetobacterium woodii]MBI5677837.1 MBL fold metallo-hydrolase [Planctomycetota bacterium]
MKVIFLGTNGWYDTATGNTTCILIAADEYYIILDAGGALYKIDQYIIDAKPIYLFLSHFHLDHIIGLHVLNKFSFKQGVRICGQKGTQDILNKIINIPYTMPFKDLSYHTEVLELSGVRSEVPFPVEVKPLLHSTTTLGFRFELENKIITYCPDTGNCENAVTLARGADLLIAECAYKSGQYYDKWPHLNPGEAAKIAKEAKVKKLVLTHFDASLYKTLGERKEAEEQAKKIFSDTIAATDDMQVEV